MSPAESGEHAPVNYALWTAFALILRSVGVYAVIEVPGRLTLEAGPGRLAHAGRTTLYVSLCADL